MAFTVTATQTGVTSVGMGIYLAVVTGQANSPIGATASLRGTGAQTPITPNGNNSFIYGANLGLAGTYTANGNTRYKQDAANNGLEYVSMDCTATVTAGTPVTIGGTATANSISICLMEVLKGSGLAEDASSPGGFSSGVTSVTTSSFAPPSGSLLVLMVQANGGGGVNTISVSDTSGLGLTWTEQVVQNQSAAGYSGVWTTVMPGAGPSGVVAPLALAAPAGIPTVTTPGLVSALALAAPAGTVAVTGAATIAGQVAALTLAAAAGIVIGPGGYPSVTLDGTGISGSPPATQGPPLGTGYVRKT